MRAAPAFELTVTLSAGERALASLLTAIVAAALGAWVWSHVDAAAGPAGRGLWPWIAVVLFAAGAGAWIGWRAARPMPRTLRWQLNRWTWSDERAVEYEGTVQARIDFGGWLLLLLRPQHGPVAWATVGRRRAGPAWHPLRAALFAPGRDDDEPVTAASRAAGNPPQ